MASNLGKLHKYYNSLKERDHYIDSESYLTGASWLSDCEPVEDWGCGKGWFAYTAPGLNVISLDGSNTPFADKVVDLEVYRSAVEGIFMRSVAEHNYGWDKILSNLLDSFSKKAFVQFYTPMNYDSSEAVLIQTSPGYDDVPELSIPASVWEDMIIGSGANFKKETIDSELVYGEETMYFISK